MNCGILGGGTAIPFPACVFASVGGDHSEEQIKSEIELGLIWQMRFYSECFSCSFRGGGGTELNVFILQMLCLQMFPPPPFSSSPRWCSNETERGSGAGSTEMPNYEHISDLGEPSIWFWGYSHPLLLRMGRKMRDDVSWSHLGRSTQPMYSSNDALAELSQHSHCFIWISLN